MVLKFESEILDTEDARGKFFHVCQGRVQEVPLAIPQEGAPDECPVCEIDLDYEDFFLAQQRGWA